MSKVCKKFFNIHHSDTRMCRLVKIGKSLNSPYKLLEVDSNVCHYNPTSEEISIGQKCEHINRDKDHVRVYKVKDGFEMPGFYLHESITHLFSTKLGNHLIGFRKYRNENQIDFVYLNRFNQIELNKPKVLSSSENVLIYHVQEEDRFYFGLKGNIDVFQEINNKFECINKIRSLPFNVVWMQEDKDNNILWVINEENFSLKQIIEFNLATNKFFTYDSPFQFEKKIFYDKSKCWLIGQTKEKKFVIWDTLKKAVVQEMTIPVNDIPLKWVEDHGWVDSAHYDEQTKQLFFVYRDERRMHTSQAVELISRKLMIWDISNQNLHSPHMEKLMVKKFNPAVHKKENEDYLFNCFIRFIDYDPVSNVVILNGEVAWDLSSGYTVKIHSSDDASLEIIYFNWNKITQTIVSFVKVPHTTKIKIFSPNNYVPKVPSLKDRISQKVKKVFGLH